MKKSFIKDEKAYARVTWDAIVVQFSEIALKRGNRTRFIKQLRQNVKRTVRAEGVEVQRFHDRILVSAPPDMIPDLLHRTSLICGVSHVAPIKQLDRDLDIMKQEAVALYRAIGSGKESFAINARRADKRFPLKSGEINRDVGAAVVSATGAPVDLTRPDVLITFRVHEEAVYLQGPPMEGPNGLPIGATQRVLTLFSGGIDSPPAAWLMQRRGCRTDFVHFHVQADPEQVRDTKIPELIRRIVEPQGLRARLFLVPYHPFEMALMASQVPPDLELIIFRRFMARVGSRIARVQNYAAIVTGDNLSQVASQTMRNLQAFDDAAECIVFRPLTTYIKQDIIELAQKLGTFELSTQDYKDCCSLVAQHPDTQPRLERIHQIEEHLPVRDMVNEAVNNMVVWHIPE